MMESHALPKARCQSFAAVVLGVLLLCGGPSFALDPGATRHTFVSLQNIAPERGREFLARLKIGTVSRLPNTNTLLITGNEIEQQEAAAVLDLVDSRTEYDIKQFGPVSPALPSNARIADAVGGLCVGTFADPPKDKTKMRAIVDVHDGQVVAIAPRMQMPDIRIAIELGPEVLRQRRTPAVPAEAAGSGAIQSVAMLGSSLDGQADEANAAGPVAVDSGRAARSLLSQRMQEMHRTTGEVLTLRQAGAEPGATTMSTAPLTGGTTSPGQPDANGVGSALPAGLEHVGAAPDPNAPPEQFTPPAASATTAAGGLQPGQRVPSEDERISEPNLEPKSITSGDASQTAAQMAAPSSASLYEPPEVPDGDQIIELKLNESLPVIDLLDLVGKYLGLTYIYDPQIVTDTVTLKLKGQLNGQLRKKDLYPLLEAALQDKDLVMTRHKGNIVRIMRKADAMKADPMIVMPGDGPIEAGNAIITKPFHLKYIDNSSAENLFQSMGLTVGLTSVPESRTIIVTAYAHRMGRIEQLLDLVDRPGAPRKFKYRQLRYTMAKTLADKVKSLAEQLENVSVTVGTAEAATGTPAQQPGESDVAYRTRLAQIRAAQNALRAQRARAAAAAGGRQTEETKPGVYLDADERTNRILMIGEDEQLSTVDELVDALDVAQQDLRNLALYRMKYVDAEEVARKLQELGIIHRLPETSTSQRYGQGQRQQQGRITAQNAAQARALQAAAAVEGATPGTELTEEGLVGEPQVVVVESTNSLLVNGTPEQHAKISSIIEYVDSEMDLEEIPYKIYPLENSSPGHLAEVLQGLIQETEQQDKDGKIETVVTKKQQEITIVPDPNTYSLIVYASKKNQEWIQTLIKQLDKRRPQVLIDVTLVEVTKTEAFNYDLNLIQSIPDMTSTSGVIDALTKPSDLAAAGTDHFADLQSSGGKFTGYYADSHINALLTAMQSKNYGRVLAKPKLLVNDNEPGLIKTEDTTYVKKTSAIPVSTGTAGTEGQLIQTSVDYAPYAAGIELDITPHISEGDLLRLDIKLTRSDFRDTENPDSPPNTTSSNVETAVTVPDGSTIILGGMLKLNQSKGGGKVPILGDIPLIGGLFRTINNSDIQSKLYVFVKAEVIRPASGSNYAMKDLTDLSDRNRTAFEKHELKFQQYQDWPGIKPQPIDPPKVLDAQ